MKEIKISVLLFLLLTLVTGVFYPAAVTIFAQAIFPQKASGSLLNKADGAPAGSALIGQPFSDPKYFWPRPSATADFQYNPLASGASNLGPTNRELINQISMRIKTLRESGVRGNISSDMVMASGSGLDPHISLQGALMQIPRIAMTRNISEEKIRNLVLHHLEDRQFGFLGEPRINVLEMNLSLDRL